ncbi:glutathione binding-like protein [Hoeflea prorocentri]|uniref:Glutathione binding-like protein n=1 Tax=Hoeflea prorocentri TaxID=1922333 RepID=A0A9X3UKD7_9HYPH|nr:glutathione binding-like protein [Hoeflea prorocentri]MCY6382269.1 glutathione binding-like protein [Hoeflea prorocentri]MDA5400069.1 glutathione binding-like protein [Hoeflea prorocentri]
MTALNSFPITQRWKPTDDRKIQLYSFATPNGVKISIALEELGLPYEAHLAHIGQDDQKTTEFLSLSPNGKIPALIDPDGPDGEPIGIFESGAILLYLAEKTGKLIPSDPVGRLECIQWLFFQMASVGPMFGQFGHFYKFAADKVTDPYPTERYQNETKRLLGVLETRLAGRQWIMGDDYTIADIATFPWVRTVRDFYEAGDVVGLDGFTNVTAWLERCLERPASQKGLKIPARP